MKRVSVNREFKALGTVVYFEIITSQERKSDAERSLEEAETIVQEKEKRLSRFDSGSELSFLNGHLDEWHKASEDIKHLAVKSLEYFKESRGVFDPRVIEVLENIGYKKGIEKDDFQKIEINNINAITTDLKDDLFVKKDKVMFRKKMDFSGVAKGYICDEIARFFRDNRWKDFLVDTGGDMFLSGHNIDNTKWIVDIEGIDTEKILLELSDEAVATSGITRRSWKIGGKELHHLVNPKKPDDFQTSFLSVSVISGTAEVSDVWAKILFLADENAYKLAESREIKAIFRLKNGEPYLSEKMKIVLIK